MKQFRNILYVSHGIHDESFGLMQALSVARNNDATLHVLVVYPEFPASHLEYRDVYEGALAQRIQDAVDAAQKALNVPPHPVAIEVQGGRARAAGIVRVVNARSHDLVIKQAEPRSDGKGLQAIDMELLRQCPVPVWLGRPIVQPREQMQVAVAIDPQTESAEERQLSIRLLQIARGLADSGSGTLRVLGCWDYEYESFLRGSVWSSVRDDELIRVVREVETSSRISVDSLVKESGISGTIDILHRRGNPVELIPELVQSLNINVLVMGTLARTGIAGYVIGNTAENVVQAVDCSLLTLKPAGFVTSLG